jgi:hypothetical protein
MINESVLLEILDLLKLTSKRSGEFYYLVECPDAEKGHSDKRDRKPSCAVGHTDRPPVFKCFACGYSGSIMDTAFLRYRNGDITRDACNAVKVICAKERDTPASTEALKARMEKLEKTIQETKMDESILDLYERAIPGWLMTEKNLTANVCKQFGVRINRNNGMIVIPVYDEKGLRGITQRNTTENGPKYLSNDGFHNHHFLFGVNHFKDIRPPLPTAGGIIIVEGQIDAMYMHQLGFTNTLGIFSSNITIDQVKLLTRYDKPVYVFLDNDDAGRRGTARAACMLASVMPCFTIQYPESIPEKADPKRMTEEQILDLLASAKYSLGG